MEICFVVRKIQRKNENPKKKLQEQRPQTKSFFFYNKKEIVFQFLEILKNRQQENDNKGIYSEKILQKKEFNGEKKVVEKRRHWPGFYAQLEVHATHILLNMQIWFFTKLSGGLKLFFLVLNGGKETMHDDRDIDHTIVVLRFADLPQFLNTKLGELVFPSHTAM